MGSDTGFRGVDSGTDAQDGHLALDIDSAVPIEITAPAGKGVQRVHTAVVVYALSGAVLWWAVHLCALASVAPAVCSGSPAWTLTAINVLCWLGVASTVAAAAWARKPRGDLDSAIGRSPFIGYVAIVFNLAALVAVTLESIPVYVLGACQ